MEKDDMSEYKNIFGESEMYYRDLFNELIEGFALHEIVCDEEGKPINYKFIHVNPAFEKMVGLKNKDIENRMVLDVLPNTEQFWIDTYGQVALTGEPIVFEHFAKGQEKYFQVTSFSPKKGQFVALFEDITDRKEAEEKLTNALMEAKKLNEMMVGREMKMIELKNIIKEQEEKIKELEEKLSSK